MEIYLHKFIEIPIINFSDQPKRIIWVFHVAIKKQIIYT